MEKFSTSLARISALIFVALTIVSSAFGQTTGGQVNGNYAPGLMVQKNYIQLNPGAELNTRGWTTYNDGASTRPVDGTGGSVTNLTWTRSTSSPLAGNGSFLLTHSAANTQGEGVSFPFTIDSKDQGHGLTILYDLSLVSGTYSNGTPLPSYTDSDLIVYIYDVTNSRLIEPTAFKVQTGVAGISISAQSLNFQASIDSTSYRLIIHTATTSASAYTVKFDDWLLGRAISNTGPPAGDMVAYTPTLTGFGTVTGLSASSGRVADKLCIQGSFTTGTTAASPATITLGYAGVNGGVTIDSTVASNSLVGHAGYGTVNTVLFDGGLLATGGGTTLSFSRGSSTTSILTPTNGNGINGNTQPVSFYGCVKIAGWSSNTAMSSDTDTRVVAMQATSSSASLNYNGGTPNSTTPTSAGQMVFSTVNSDTHGAYNSTTGVYTIPVTGFYAIAASYNAGATTTHLSDLFSIQIFNATTSAVIISNTVIYDGASTNGKVVSISVPATLLNAGTQIYIRGFNSGSTTPVYLGTVNQDYFMVSRVSGPSQIAASESVEVRYENRAGTTINTVATNTPYATKIRDTHNAFVGSTGTFTAPSPGWYNIQMGYATGAATISTANAIVGNIYYSGSTNIAATLQEGSGVSSVNYRNSISTSYYLNVGDTLSLQLVTTTGSFALDTTAGANFIAITRTGN